MWGLKIQYTNKTVEEFSFLYWEQIKEILDKLDLEKVHAYYVFRV